MSEIVLSLQNICKDYRQGPTTISVLHDVNLDLCTGEMMGIVGASGSGKSSLLHIAGLLDEPSSGTIKIMGHSSNTKNSNLIRLHNIGFVYQYHHLQRDFTAIENVAMPLLIAGIERYAAQDKAKELLIRLGLEKRLYNFPSMLSGGEQQRVAIARALINTPKILLADEPTGNLDPVTANEVFSLLLEQVKDFNIAVLMVTHNMELASRMDRIHKL